MTFSLTTWERLRGPKRDVAQYLESLNVVCAAPRNVVPTGLVKNNPSIPGFVATLLTPGYHNVIPTGFD